MLAYSAADKEDVQCLGLRTRQRLVELICRHKERLRRELQVVDAGSSVASGLMLD